MTDKETKPKIKTYEELTVEERYKRIEALWLQIEDVIKGNGSGDIESFFICLHKVGEEIKRFIQHFFNDKDSANIIKNIDILNKVNKIQLMISIR